jgi:hypothetical protein
VVHRCEPLLGPLGPGGLVGGDPEVLVDRRVLGYPLPRFQPQELVPDGEQKKLLAALIVISTGVTDPGDLGVPPEVGHRLLACHAGLAGG